MELNIDANGFFQGDLIPENTKLAGWSALVQGLKLEAPVRYPSSVSNKHVKNSQRTAGRWRIFDKRYAPTVEVFDHLAFALRHEVIDLLILKRAFDRIPAEELCRFITATPSGTITRRIWFFYETLTGQRLDIDDAPNAAAVDALDPDAYFTGTARLSRRHRVRDNLLGQSGFCPVVRKTETLQKFIDLDLAEQAAATVGRTGGHLLARAASFMLFADSRASFEIEGERAPQGRLERWGRAVLEAGKRPLNQTEIYRLHRILTGDDRFTKIGYRDDGVFLGERDHNNDPLPEFIGARQDDLPDLMLGLNDCNNRMRPAGIDPVIQAAIIAFGFVYIHPLQDGNGRLHRCLIHHVLTERKFAPPGMVFPVSSVMQDRIDEYREVLQSHTGPLMNFIEWKPTPDKNIEVLNDTADLYRYFDCTDAAEFLYACVQRTIEHDLPKEISYLLAHDTAKDEIMGIVEMPDRLAGNLINFVRQNQGMLPKNRRKKEFALLTDDEVVAVEAIIQQSFREYIEKFE
jgi:Fic family protein